jgi:hypothetical protein
MSYEEVAAKYYGMNKKIPTDTILHYKFDNNLIDSSAVGNHGIGSGTYSYGIDRKGNANSDIQITNGIVGTTNNIDLSGIDKVSVSFWIKTSQSATTGTLVENSPQFYTNNAFNISVNAIIQNALFVGDSGQGLNMKESSVAIATNNWIHCILTIDRSQNNLTQNNVYVNNAECGILNASYRNDNYGGFTNQHKIYIGARAGVLFPFVGLIDDLRIYPRILNIDERKALKDE